MADDLQASLEQYKIQLQQVEAALSAEPENEELKKLKVDLEEIINITQELIQPTSTRGPHSPTSNGNASDDEGGSAEKAAPKAVKEWRVGDRCMAVWSKNSQYYAAIIEGISEGKAAVAFEGYNVTEMNKLIQLRPYVEQPAAKKYVWDSKARGNRAQFQADKEKRRVKALKKAQRLKQIEEDKESDKRKWKEFATKAAAKSMKGVKRESIFASPDTTKGRVGVGTCGVSDKPMTKPTAPQTTHVPTTSKTNRSVF